MKEILKHYEPEFAANDTGQIVDSNGVFLCTVQSCWANKVDFAKEIAAALNKAADDGEAKKLKSKIRHLEGQIREWQEAYYTG